MSSIQSGISPTDLGPPGIQSLQYTWATPKYRDLPPWGPLSPAGSWREGKGQGHVCALLYVCACVYMFEHMCLCICT